MYCTARAGICHLHSSLLCGRARPRRRSVFLCPAPVLTFRARFTGALIGERDYTRNHLPHGKGGGREKELAGYSRSLVGRRLDASLVSSGRA